MSYLQAVVGSQELLAVACSDGSFRLLSKGSRVEKKVEDAHSGAVGILNPYYFLDYLY